MAWATHSLWAPWSPTAGSSRSSATGLVATAQPISKTLFGAPVGRVPTGLPAGAPSPSTSSTSSATLARLRSRRSWSGDSPTASPKNTPDARPYWAMSRFACAISAARAPCWNDRPSPRLRVRSAGVSSDMAWPRNQTWPCDGVMKPLKTLNVVVLPAPLVRGCRRPRRDRRRATTQAMATLPPKRTVTSRAPSRTGRGRSRGRACGPRADPGRPAPAQAPRPACLAARFLTLATRWCRDGGARPGRAGPHRRPGAGDR